MHKKKVGLAVGTLAVLGGGVVTGAVLSGGGAVAASGSTAGSSAATAGTPRHDHTDVTGAELSKVTAAVQADDSSVTVESVRKDPDGSYDVFGTKDGAPVMLEVSADLGTISEDAGRPGGPGGPDGHGGHGDGPEGASADTPVTGAELTRVTDAVAKEDAAVTVESVRKDPDGSYDVFGTKDGVRVMLEVSADLGTITEDAGHPGGRDDDQADDHDGDHDGQDGPGSPSGTTPSSGATTSAYVVPA